LPRLNAGIELQLGYLDGALKGRQDILGDELSAADIKLSFIGELAERASGSTTIPTSGRGRSALRPGRPAKGGAYSFA
jgi:glutathione S-transferase